MTGLIDIARNEVDERCLVSGKLTKDGCSVLLKDAPQPRLVVDFDKPGSPLTQNETRCDYLFFAEEDDFSWIAPIELKKGKLHAKEVIKQLQAGANVAEKVTKKWTSESEGFKFRPVAVCGGTVHKGSIKILKDNPVKFRRVFEPVRTIRCGGTLKNGLMK